MPHTNVQLNSYVKFAEFCIEHKIPPTWLQELYLLRFDIYNCWNKRIYKFLNSEKKPKDFEKRFEELESIKRAFERKAKEQGFTTVWESYDKHLIWADLMKDGIKVKWPDTMFV